MQWCADGMAVWCAADRSGDGDASGMSDPEVCISGGVGPGRTWSLVGKEVKIGEQKLIRKAMLYLLCPNGVTAFWAIEHCSASDLQRIERKKTDS